MKITFNGSNHADRGFSLLEMIAALGLLSIVMTAVVVFFFDMTFHSNDQQLMLQANQAARALIDELGSELRMAGNGLPLGQTGFSAADASLGDAPLPVLPESDEDHIVFRSNTRGNLYLLSSDFNPAEDSSPKLVSTEGLQTGMEIYISNAPVLGVSGLKGKISSVSSDSVTLQDIHAAPPGSVFASGSILEPVMEIELNSLPDFKGIERIMESSREILLPNSGFSIKYLESGGGDISPPLSAAAIADRLSAIDLTVRVRARRQLRSGADYTAELHRTIALRNVCLNR